MAWRLARAGHQLKMSNCGIILGVPLARVVGGEEVRLLIHCYANEDITCVIVGFPVKDRLGQGIFTDSTFLGYGEKPVSVKAGKTLDVQFSFRMLHLPLGDYSIIAAIAEGTQMEHIQHHWFNDAMIFKVHSSSVCHGLIGVAMKDISMRVK